MIVFPPAKINLGLNVVRRRTDGYHEIESAMLPIPLQDVLEAVVDPAVPEGEVVYTRSGLPVPGDASGDLCMKAWGLLKERHHLPGLRMHLHKVIPMGAGLGGGSSDGAHTLLLLDGLLGLGHSREELATMAASLGSDCPFFLNGTPQLAQGRGELLRPVAIDLSGWWLTVVNPGIHVPTPEVYRNTVPTGELLDLAQRLTAHPVEKWRKLVPNVMESYVFQAYPDVGELKAQLLSMGAVYAAMSGSGSTVYGLFRQGPQQMTMPPGHVIWSFKL